MKSVSAPFGTYKKVLRILSVFIFFTAIATKSFAAVSITAPNLAISTCAYPSAYFALGSIIIDEGAVGDFPDTNNNDQTFTITAPTNFQFQAGVGTVTCIASRNITNLSIAVTATTIVVTYDCPDNDEDDAITISGIMVRATAASATVNVTKTASSNTVSGFPNPTTVATVSATTLGAPSVTGNPSNISVCPGTNPTFTVTSTGSSLTYQWQVDPGTTVFSNITNGGVYSGATSATLTLTGITFAYNGYKFRCIVTGCGTSVTSTSGTLTVNSISATAGADQTVCTSTATLAGNTPSVGSGTWTLVSGTGAITTPSSPTSGVTGLTSGAASTFRWTTSDGSCSALDDVIITFSSGPASAPGGSAATTITNSSFNANWTTVAGATGYFLDVATDAAFTSFVSGFNNLDVANVTTYSISGLLPGTTYYYRVRAYNNCGANPTNSNTISATTTNTPNYVPFSGNNTITACGGTIQDSQGNSNYVINSNGYTVINPSIAGYVVSLTFTQFALETCCDFVTVFDGAGTGGTILFNGNGTTMPPVITSTSGSLTIRFTSDGSVVAAGFTASISCIGSCTGTPTGGTAVATPTSITSCASPSTSLSLSGASTSTGLNYQWQSATAAAGPWTNITGATSSTYSTGVYGNTYFRCIITCSSTGLTGTSGSVLVTSTITGPANDNCSGAIALTMNTFGSCASTSAGNVACASASNTATGSCFGNPNDDIWYSFVATASTHYITLTTASGFDAYMQLYSGTCTSLTSLQCSDANTFTATGLAAGSTYFIRVYSYSATAPANGNLTMCVAAPPVCPGALGSGNVSIASLPYSATGQTTCGAGDELTTTNTAVCGSTSYLYDEDKVYIFTPAVSGQITVTLNSTQSWTGATLYQGCPFSGTCVSYVQSSSSGSKTFCANVTAGVQYYLVIDSYITTGACITSFTLDITAPSGIPSGTVCATAPAISLPYSATGHTTACYGNEYTSTSTGSCGTSYESGEDRVYAFTTTGSECIGITLSNSNTSSIGFQVYSGCPGTAGTTCIGSGGGATSGTLSGSITVPAAGTYYLVIDTWASPSFANYDISVVSFGTGPVNDLPCNATLMTLGITETGDNTCSGSTSEPAAPSCWFTGTNNSVWYQVVPTGTTLKIKTSLGTLSNTQIQVYSGTCGSLTAVASSCNDDSPACGSSSDYSSTLSLSGLTAGATYFIRVDGYGSLVGTFGIIAIDGAATFPPVAGQDCSLGNPVCNSTMSISNPGYQGIGASCDIPASYCLASAERGSAWYSWTTNSAGNINFDIIPNDWPGAPSTTSTDYDFALWKVSGSVSCTTILSGAATPLRCNYSGLGVTGLSPTGNAPAAYPGYDASYETQVPCAAGETWILLINNHSTSTQGFTINFATGASGAPINYTPSPTSIAWSGGSNTSWNLASNWGGCAVPICGIDATVGVFTNQPNITAAMGAQYVKNLTINLGATLTLSAGSVLHICGNLVNNGTINASPTSTIIFDNASTTQTMTGNFTGTSKLGNLTITKTGGSVVTNDDIDVGGTFTTTNATSIFNTNGKYMRVAGNFVNSSGNSTFTNVGTTGTLEFNGSAAQTYNEGSAMLDLNFVLMNNSSTGTGLTLQTNMNIISGTGTLTLTAGKITTGAFMVIVNNSAPGSVSAGNSASYVSGNLRRYIDYATGSFDFPVGIAASYQRANVNFTSAPTTIEYLTAFFQTYATVPAALGSTECGTTYDAAALNNGFWSIAANTANNNSGVYNMTLYNTGYSNAASGWTIMSRHNGSATWALVNGDGTTGTCVAGAVTAVVRNNMVGFSLFGTAQATVPLPIELIAFSGKNEGTRNKIEWSTMSETNNDFFSVERSEDGSHFENFATKDGAGNSTHKIDYMIYDNAPFNGVSYYRLKQTDFDGKFTYSSIIAIENNLDEISVSNVHPNPTTNDMSFDFYTPVSGSMHIQVIDYTGRVVSDRFENITEGKSIFNTQIGILAKGVYSLKITFDHGNFVSYSKIIKQ
ncbi:MAG TPA: fibronectin type III domain-containing protein [Bacteroidia bacterium]